MTAAGIGDTEEVLMVGDKAEWVHDLFNQIETQVQFGDTKASLLVAADAILLALGGGVIQWVSGCAGPLTRACPDLAPSVALVAAVIATALLLAALGLALRASMPSWKHRNPPREFFLFSYLARLTPEDVAKWYAASSYDDLVLEAFKTVNGKAKYATAKFLWLRGAVFATMAGLVALSLAVLAHATPWILGSLSPRS